MSGSYFHVLGREPLIGRTFTDAEMQDPAAPVVLLGYDAWQRKFNGDPNIVGRRMRMSRTETPPTIIGVMPPGVRFLPSPVASQEPDYNVNGTVDFWQPGGLNPQRMQSPFRELVARPRAGVTVEQEHAELRAIAAREG